MQVMICCCFEILWIIMNGNRDHIKQSPALDATIHVKQNQYFCEALRSMFVKIIGLNIFPRTFKRIFLRKCLRIIILLFLKTIISRTLYVIFVISLSKTSNLDFLKYFFLWPKTPFMLTFQG